MTEKQQAIRECKTLWQAIRKSGLDKMTFMLSTQGEKWLNKEYPNDCPLCAYDSQFGDDCNHCPLVVQYDKSCWDLGYVYRDKCTTAFFEAIENLEERSTRKISSEA